MKKYNKILLILAILVISLLFAISADAAPINGLEQTLTQPNGTEILVYLYGDEIFNYMTDVDGNVIVKNPETGYYVYAKLQNNTISPTDYIYGINGLEKANSRISGVLTAENIPESEYVTAFQNSRFYTDSNTAETMSLDYDEQDFNGMEINNIVIFIRFSGTGYTKSSLSYYDGLFNTNDDSAKNYYEEVSYGKLGINSTFYPATDSSTILTYKDSHAASYYNASSYDYDWRQQREREQSLFKRAIEYVKDEIPENMNIDKNNDGKVDMITFVLPGKITSGESQVCWPHIWSFVSDYSTTINGVETDLYNVQIEGALRGLSASNDSGANAFQSGSAIICHETLHILGFPDMYYCNFNYPTNKVSLGEWDIMCQSNGAHTPAYMKYTYGGWLDIPEIKEEGTYTLNSLQNGGTCAYKLRSPNSANEYFIVEYRKSSGEFENNIPSTGLVIYRVLANHHEYGNCGAVKSDGTDDELRYLACKTSGSYSPKLSTGSTAGISLSSISATGDTATFTVSFTEKKYLIYFNDENLANDILAQIGIDESDVTEDVLKSLRSLTIKGDKYKQHYDLTGIEQLTGLTTLSIEDCGVDDISCLANLTNLNSLTLNNNHISDISPLSNLVNLKTLNLRGNYIDDYSPVSSYYNNLTTKDFSLTDENDAVFFVPNFSDGVLGTVYVRLSNTRSTLLYYSLEKCDATNDKLLSRKRGSISVSESVNVKAVEIPETFFDDEDTYVKLSVYENDTYRHLMSETIIDSSVLDLKDLK